MKASSVRLLDNWLSKRLASDNIGNESGVVRIGDVVDISDRLALFDKLGNLLIEACKKFNLTSITDESGVIVKHFIDSLEPAFRVKELHSLLVTSIVAGFSNSNPFSPSLLDIGAGAGFPGIPLKILFGDALNVTLIDSTLKKVNFMNDAVAELALKNCYALHIRAEDAARDPNLRGEFDFVISRAVAALPKLIRYSAPFLSSNGIIVAMKGRREQAEQEIHDSADTIRALGLRFVSLIHYTLGFDSASPVISDAQTTVTPVSNDSTSIDTYARTMILFKQKHS